MHSSTKQQTVGGVIPFLSSSVSSLIDLSLIASITSGISTFLNRLLTLKLTSRLESGILMVLSFATKWAKFMMCDPCMQSSL